jgi:hypothetical protein
VFWGPRWLLIAHPRASDEARRARAAPRVPGGKPRVFVAYVLKEDLAQLWRYGRRGPGAAFGVTGIGARSQPGWLWLESARYCDRERWVYVERTRISTQWIDGPRRSAPYR